MGEPRAAPIIKATDGHYVNIAPQGTLQVVLQVDCVKEIVAGTVLHKKIHVAIWAFLPAGA